MRYDPAMSEARLKSGFWVQALVLGAQRHDAYAVVARKGDADAGAILLKQSFLDGTCTVLSQLRAPDGRPAWRRATGPVPVPEAEADALIARHLARDGDLWVVDIESPRGWLPEDCLVLG